MSDPCPYECNKILCFSFMFDKEVECRKMSVAHPACLHVGLDVIRDAEHATLYRDHRMDAVHFCVEYSGWTSCRVFSEKEFETFTETDVLIKVQEDWEFLKTQVKPQRTENETVDPN